VLVHPESANIVFTAGREAGMPSPLLLSVSHDTGATWTRTLVEGEEGICLVLEPTSTSPRVYAAGYSGGSGIVMVTDDYGRSWKRTDAAPPSAVRDVAVDPGNPDLAYAATEDGLFQTTDGGDSWASICSISGLRAVEIDPRWSDVLYVGGRSGVYRRWVYWQPFSTGLPATGVTRLEWAGDSIPVLLAGTEDQACYAYAHPNAVTESGSAIVLRPAGSLVGQVGQEVVFAAGAAGDCRVAVFDAAGRSIASGPVRVGTGGTAAFRMPDRAGVYVLRVLGSGAGRAVRLVVVR
jgi:photosystem II stability/assembly factor-like uncharacterized protein